jgi:hypothetical protein
MRIYELLKELESQINDFHIRPVLQVNNTGRAGYCASPHLIWGIKRNNRNNVYIPHYGSEEAKWGLHVNSPYPTNELSNWKNVPTANKIKIRPVGQ